MVRKFRVAILSNGFMWKIYYIVPLDSGDMAAYDTGNLNVFESFDKIYIIMGTVRCTHRQPADKRLAILIHILAGNELTEDRTQPIHLVASVSV